MLAFATPSILPDPDLLAFLGALEGDKTRSLAFRRDGKELQPGYHVTEVKAARFNGLDCGANREAWSETFVQLWDVAGPSGEKASPMTTGRFLAIMAKFAKAVGIDPSAKVTFEVSDPTSAIALYAADGIVVDGDRVLVTLAPRPASCKPRDRWLEEDASDNASCCAPSASRSTNSCCN